MGMMRTYALLAALTAIFGGAGFLLAGQIGLIIALIQVSDRVLK